MIVVMCDLCGQRVLGNFETITAERPDGSLVSYEVGHSCCYDGPFKIPATPPARVVRKAPTPKEGK